MLPQASRTVIVLSKLDERYFDGLIGQYWFDLAFRLHQSGQSAHIIRGYSSGDRSATAEVDLEAGHYDVLLQISGTRNSTAPKVEDVVKQNWLSRRSKLLQTGLSYDLAHAKGQTDYCEESSKGTEDQDAMSRAEKNVIEIEDPKTNKTSNALAMNGSASTSEQEQQIKMSSRNAQGVLGSAINESIAADNDESEDKGTVSDMTHDGEILKSTGEDAVTKQDEVPPAVASLVVSAAPDKEKDLLAEDPWNAICVVGLRVFCYNTTATIKVVGSDSKDTSEAHDTKLDVDDAQKDAAEAAKPSYSETS